MEPEEELHSFPYSETVAGVEHNYRITENGNKFDVEKDGVVIAEIAHADRWQQLTGRPLSKDVLESICDHIESYCGKKLKKRS
jgi:hypothetical protein